MKKMLLIAFFFAGMFVSCTQDSEQGIEEVQADGKISSVIRNPISAEGIKDTVNVAKLEFVETQYDFGEVDEGEVVIKSFAFTNTGKIPLIINGARSTCGCTIPTWPKEPIPPGETGSIEVQFKTEGKRNEQKKPVTITANTYPSESVVYLNGFVKAKPDSPITE